LLTLIGGLRVVQSGSLRVLGQELSGIGETARAVVRQQIGYIFQSHNLLGSLTAQENVEIALNLSRNLSQGERRKRSLAALDAVGLLDRVHSYPSELSGGQRQRVAIARALSSKPKLILADEPTASLDKRTGRTVVELIHDLSKRDGATVVLVTHDNRILDIADRILTLSEGRMSSLVDQVTRESSNVLQMLARDLHSGELSKRVDGLDEKQFIDLMNDATRQTEEFLGLVDLIQGSAFRAIQSQVLTAFTQKTASLIGAEEPRLYFTDDEHKNPWLVDNGDVGTRMYSDTNDDQLAVERVLDTGEPYVVARSHNSHGGDQAALTTRERCGAVYLPLKDKNSVAFAVFRFTMPLRDASLGLPASQLLEMLSASCSAILLTWWQMGCDCRRQRNEKSGERCGEA
jgi:putative ABC transport system ATP-binding protein